jgi:hypothetical protein
MGLQKPLIHFLALVLILAGISFSFRNQPHVANYADISLKFFLPGLSLIFLAVFFLSAWFLKVIEQPPLMIFLLSMVIKMLASLSLLLVYLLNKIGPANEGAVVFIFTYGFFEVNEIRRFVSILRPNSGNITPK